MEVIKVSSEEINKMKQHYSKSITSSIPQGGIFLAKVDGCTITAYKSGKVMFQGKNFAKEAGIWNSNSSVTINNSSQVSTTKAKNNTLPNNFASLSVLGSDEVGTGDFFGPMVIASAYVDKKHIPLLKELGVKDSKDLTDTQISAIAKQIIQFLPYSLLVLHNKKYNELQQAGNNQGKLKAILHNQALNNTLQKIAPVKPEGILIDQFCEPGVYFNYLKGKEIIRENVHFSTKAEGVHIAVAAASIIARHAFVQHFELLSKEVGISLPKGAGAKVDEVAAKLINQNGIGILNNISKLHFANTEKAMKKVTKMK